MNRYSAEWNSLAPRAVLRNGKLICVADILATRKEPRTMAVGGDGQDVPGDELVWLKGTEGELMNIRVDSRSTEGAYAVIEAVHEPDCFVPTHLHRNEEEHFLVLNGEYRIAIGDEIIDAGPGTRATVPRNTPHSWRNVASTQGRLLVVLTPGGFEQLAWAVQGVAPEDQADIASQYGCDILGPPAV